MGVKCVVDPLTKLLPLSFFLPQIAGYWLQRCGSRRWMLWGDIASPFSVADARCARHMFLARRHQNDCSCLLSQCGGQCKSGWARRIAAPPLLSRAVVEQVPNNALTDESVHIRAVGRRMDAYKTISSVVGRRRVGKVVVSPWEK